EVPGALFTGALTAWVIARYGLLGLIASWLVRLLLQITPLPVAATSPYAFQTILCLAALLVLVAWRSGCRSAARRCSHSTISPRRCARRRARPRVPAIARLSPASSIPILLGSSTGGGPRRAPGVRGRGSGRWR